MPTEIIDPPIAHSAKPTGGKESQVGAKRSKTKPVAATAPEEESHGDDEPSVSSATDDDSQKEVTTPSRGGDEESASKADTGTPSTAADTWETPAKKKKPPTPKKGRSPAVKGLSIPFRTVKKVSVFYGSFMFAFRTPPGTRVCLSCSFFDLCFATTLITT